jgi:hypothetical protein
MLRDLSIGEVQIGEVQRRASKYVAASGFVFVSTVVMLLCSLVVCSMPIAIAWLSLAVAFTVSGQIVGFNGTWKLDPSKTTGPHAKSEVLIFRVTAGEEHYTVDEVEPDGSLFKTEYTAKFDGKTYPNKNLVTGAITYVSLKKIDDRNEVLESRNEPGGAVTYKYRRVLSGDGKTLTSSIIDADGTIYSVRVFEKQ